MIVLEKQEEELEKLRIENQQYQEQLEELESINNSLMMQIINYQTSVEKLQQQISELGSLKQ